MGKDIKHLTTVLWKCDGCGKEHVHTDPTIESNHALPPGWLQLFISTKERIQQSKYVESYMAVNGNRNRYIIELEVGEKELDSLISCDLCFKKLRDAFRSKFQEEPKAQWHKPPPTAPSSDGHGPKQETFIGWMKGLFTRER